MSVQTSRSTSAEIRAESPPGPAGLADTYPNRAPKQAWLVVALLFLFMAINFADKAVIGIAAVPMMHELRLTPSQFGLIGSSFFLLFSVSAIVTGFVVNRVQTRWALLAMGLVWALTQFPMLANVGFATVVACRIALGAGEGPAAPVALHSAYKWFPNELRTLPTAVSRARRRASASWWRCRCSTGSSSTIPGTGPLACSASPVCSGPGRGWRLGARAPSPRLRHRVRRRLAGQVSLWTAVVEPDNRCVLVRQFRRLLGPFAGAFLAGGISDQRAGVYARPRSACWARCRRRPAWSWSSPPAGVRSVCSPAECRAGWRAAF